MKNYTLWALTFILLAIFAFDAVAGIHMLSIGPEGMLIAPAAAATLPEAISAELNRIGTEAKDKLASLQRSIEEDKTTTKAEIDKLRAAVDDANLKLSAAKTASGGIDPNAANLDGDGMRVLRTPADFKAHYANRGQAQTEDGDREKPSLHEFMCAVAGMKPEKSERFSGAVMASMSVGQDSSGGYAVPDIVMPDILSALVPASSLLQAGAGIVPMDSGAKTVSTVITETLPTAAWRNELGEIAESEPTFRANTAAPKSLAVIIRISRELLHDANDVERALRQAIAQAFAKELDRVGLRGSGTSPEPRGLSNIAGVNQVVLGANGTALENYRPLLAAYGSTIANDAPVPTSAIMSGRTLLDFEGLADTTNQPLRRPRLLESMGFHQTTQIPNDLELGTSGDTSEIYVGDFSGLYFLMRENLSIGLLREAYAKTGEIGFLCHVRADVVVNYPKQFTIVRGVRPAAG